MLVVMQAQATEEQVRAVCEKVETMGLRAHAIPGAQRIAIGVTGNSSTVEPGTLDDMAGVAEVIRVSKPYKLVSREAKDDDSVIGFDGCSIGGRDLIIMAGHARSRAANRPLPSRSGCRRRARSSSAAAHSSRERLLIPFRDWVWMGCASWPTSVSSSG
jgi:hypothetical protein